MSPSKKLDNYTTRVMKPLLGFGRPRCRLSRHLPCECRAENYLCIQLFVTMFFKRNRIRTEYFDGAAEFPPIHLETFSLAYVKG